MSAVEYHVDPNDPRAPSQEVWDQLSEAQRARVLASLPGRSSALPDEVERRRLDEMVAHTDALRARTDALSARADEAAANADAEAARADRLAAKLRELGVDPDDL